MRFAALLVLLGLLALASCKKKSTTGGGTPTPPTPAWDPNAIRGAWITTTASTALDNRDNIRQMVNTCKAAGINHLFVVVYNNARTTYPSNVMNNLIGKPILERFAGRDPLQECIEEGHAAGLKVHAWFEYGFSSSYSAGGGSIVAAKTTHHILYIIPVFVHRFYSIIELFAEWGQLFSSSGNSHNFI